MPKKPFTYISLFSCAGVGCYGFKQAGFQCVATNELSSRRITIQKYNHRTPPDNNSKGKGAIIPTGISLPNVREVTHEEWDRYSFDKESALAVMRAEENEWDFYVNMENIYLQSELKPVAKNEAKMKLIKARYKYSMVLIGLSILGYGKNHHNPDDDQKSEIEEPEKTISLVTKMISPVILPMIDVMGDDLNNLIE